MRTRLSVKTRFVHVFAKTAAEARVPQSRWLLLLLMPSAGGRVGGGATRLLRYVASLWIAGAIAMLGATAARADDCLVGAYRLSDRTIVDIAPSEGQTLRWRAFDGRTGALTRQPDGSWSSTYGWTKRPDGKRVMFSDCQTGDISFAGKPGRRIPLGVVNTSFTSGGVKLIGRLILPPGRERVPLVVLVQGAEHDSALEFNFLQRLLPAEGVGAFVYDKRGTGASGGNYTQDYSTLAADAVAALEEARRLAGPRAGRVGYQGGSQGGWVAPLAALNRPVDFVIVSFGLAVSPLAAERESIEHEVRAHIPGPAGAKAADSFANAIERVAISNFREGFDQLDAVRQRYGSKPWFKHIGGEFARFLLDTPNDDIRKEGPPLISGIDLNYDPMPVLRKLNVPQLWVLGGKDVDAAPYETVKRLGQLRATGRPITVAIYANAEHGMTDFEVKGGERISTVYPPGYFEMIRDFARDGSLKKHYGTPEIRPSGA
jgi:dienelactone hydrolase